MLKEDLSIDTTFTLHKFSSDSTFNVSAGLKKHMKQLKNNFSFLRDYFRTLMKYP